MGIQKMQDTAAELSQFQQYAKDRLDQGDQKLSLDELFDEWRLMHPSESEFRESCLAVSASLRDLENGVQGRSAEQVLHDLKAKFGLGG